MYKSLAITMMINVMRNTCIGTGGGTQHLRLKSCIIASNGYDAYRGDDKGFDVHRKALLSSDLASRKEAQQKCKRTNVLSSNSSWISGFCSNWTCSSELQQQQKTRRVRSSSSSSLSNHRAPGVANQPLKKVYYVDI